MTAAPGRRWFVALDVDGTLMHEDERIDDVVAEAVASAVARGHLVTLATGRSWATTRPVLEHLGLEPEYVVTANGAITMRRDPGADGGWSQAHVETFDPSDALRKIRDVLPSGRFLVELPDGYRLYTRGMTDWNLDRAREVEFDELFGQEATRVVATSVDHELDEFFRIVEQMGLHHVSYAIGWTAWLDIAPDGVNKATALERVRGWLELPLDRVIAVGDGRNDIEMFHWAGSAGRAVAMGQAPPEVVAAASERTGAIDEAGLVAVLDSLP
ncbi:HAD family hydrolase [Agromyces marinus]|uniref:Haloacid dehalogenase n=1 Tax=Agromyces marinus TaxID=1389020 RepID=A0ABN6YBB4_9MICO|nr:HAD family hydrolase [Agromyces marinus]UIP57431.1 5-amino-6-(5-phospho-D-ribitylamino)uracil phosphatase YitU [Agromyces marinus]BDZ54446.1 haloacid dehalogenase [Agromyces marinus]